jgi:hypothetical protein
MSALEFRAVDIRADIELLQGLNRQEVDLIFAAARARRFSAKSVMTYQGEPADHLLLLWKGRARYFFETPNGKNSSWYGLRQVVPSAGRRWHPDLPLISSARKQCGTVSCWFGMAQPFVLSRDASLNFWKMQSPALWITCLGMSLPTPLYVPRLRGRDSLVYFSGIHPAWAKGSLAALNSISPTKS